MTQVRGDLGEDKSDHFSWNRINISKGTSQPGDSQNGERTGELKDPVTFSFSHEIVVESAPEVTVDSTGRRTCDRGKGTGPQKQHQAHEGLDPAMLLTPVMSWSPQPQPNRHDPS